MAKVTFTKLGLKPNNKIVNIHFNEQVIEVKQYLPVEDKLELMSRVLDLAHDSNNFSNPVKLDVYLILEIFDKYTNISFTEKQKEIPTKLYDLLVGNGLVEQVLSAIPKEEYEMLYKNILAISDGIYTYHNSVLGILETVSADYQSLELDATNIRDKIADPSNMALLKDIITKLG